MGAPTTMALGPKSQEIVDLHTKYIRGGFGTLPVVISKAKGCTVEDADGNEYLDFISMFAVMNMGHGHPKIVAAAVEAMQDAPLVNKAWIHPTYPKLAERLCKKFGYDMMTSMMSGSEAAESAVKIARKWAYTVKGVKKDEAWILTTSHCFHGLTLATMPLSDVISDNYGEHIRNVGPHAPTSGKLVKFGDVDDLREALEADAHRIAAFMIEPIQGASGVNVPPDGYLKAAADLCKKHNVLFIVDEVQTGFGRCGTTLCHHHEPGVKPDLVCLGKAVTGGMYPMSIVMGTKEVMSVISRFQIASTFAAPPTACAAAMAALDVLEDEDLVARSNHLGNLLYDTLTKLNPPHILAYRGKGRGLFQCIVVDESVPGVTGRRVAALCARRGLLVGNTENRIRFSPPLVMSDEDIIRGAHIVDAALREVHQFGEFPGSDFLF